MNPLIHIGYPKTATTWFQEIYYPNIKGIHYISTEEVFEKIIRPHSLYFDNEATREYFKPSSITPQVICQENLLGFMNLGGHNGVLTKEFANRIKQVFPSANIVIFIRNQVDIIASAYFNYIQNGGTYSVNHFLFPRGNISLNFNFQYFEYDRILNLYETLFGKDNIHVFLFEEFRNSPEKTIESYTEKFNFSIDPENLNFSSVNDRYRKILFQMARFSNIFTRERTQYKYYLLPIPRWYYLSRRIFKLLNKFSIFGKIPSSVDILGNKNVTFIKDYYRESNNTLLKRFRHLPIKKYGYETSP